ncbi:MAG: RES family NAD+ phosphorylase [Acidipropionibacterium sp.]|nr:RES family NAD+ phosphorylase [Acidipropionibacterium sp.]
MLWRVHRTTGEHVLAWNRLRTWGPVTAMRWDPQPPPAGSSEDGVSYAATDLTTTLAETFQSTRVIDTESFAPQITAWQPTRPLSLLDLTGTWPLRNGAAAALTAAPRPTCRAWAQAIRATWPSLDGLWVGSTMTGGHNVVLWSPAAGTYPAAPTFSQPLSHPSLMALATVIASEDLHYGIV